MIGKEQYSELSELNTYRPEPVRDVMAMEESDELIPPVEIGGVKLANRISE